MLAPSQSTCIRSQSTDATQHGAPNGHNAASMCIRSPKTARPPAVDAQDALVSWRTRTFGNDRIPLAWGPALRLERAHRRSGVLPLAAYSPSMDIKKPDDVRLRDYWIMCCYYLGY
jgi:hypothetical protein